MGRRAARDRTPRQRALAQLCARHDTTWREIADALGVSVTTLGRWATGDNPEGVTMEAVRRAARAAS